MYPPRFRDRATTTATWVACNQASLCGMHFWLLREPARIHFATATHQRCDSPFGVRPLLNLGTRFGDNCVTKSNEFCNPILTNRHRSAQYLRCGYPAEPRKLRQLDAPVQLKLNDPSRAWRRWGSQCHHLHSRCLAADCWKCRWYKRRVTSTHSA